MKLSQKLVLAAAVASFSLVTSFAQAQDKVSSSDKKFLVAAAGSGLYEVKVSELAAGKTNSAKVKEHAQMLVKDHKAANEKLQALAERKGVALPTDVPPAKQAKIDNLDKKMGTAFDKAYIEDVGIKDHRADIALFEKQERTASDADVKAFAKQTLPTLKEHLAHARQLKASGVK